MSNNLKNGLIVIGFIVVITIAFLLFARPSRAQNQNDLPTTFDMVMLAGADYSLALTNKNISGTPIDLTGYQFKAQFRSAATPTGTLFATYSTSTTNTAAGQFKVTLSRAQTTALTGKIGVWDLLQIDNTGKYTFLLSGKAVVKPTVTAP